MSRPINVLYVLPTFGTGGTEHLVAELVTHLDPARFRPMVCVQQDGLVGAAVARAGYPVHVLNGSGSGAGPRSLAKLRALQARSARLREIVERERIDVVHTHHLGPLLHAFLAGRPSRRWRWVHTEHNRPDVDVRFPSWLLALWRWMLGAPDAVTGVSDAVGEYFLTKTRVSPGRIHVIANGVDVERFERPSDVVATRARLGIPSEAWIVGTVGNLRPEKNHELFLRAFARVNSIVPDAWAVLVGDGECRPCLETLASDLGIAARTRLLGARLDVPDLLAAFDVFCLPSRYEGMPLTLFEAMAAGKPVVATRVAGIREVARDGQTALLVPPDDPAALGAALLCLSREGALARRLGKAGHEYVRAHARFDDVVTRYTALYTELMEA